MSRVGRWRGGVQGVRGQAGSPLLGECPPRAAHRSVSNTPSSTRTGPFRSSGSPTAFTGWHPVDPHNRPVQLIQPGPLEEGRRELPKSLAPALVLPPQEVHQLGVDIGVHLLEVLMGVADAKVLTPAPENRVKRPNLVIETVDVVVPDRIADLLAHALHRLRGWPPIAVKSLRIAPHRLQPEVHPEEVKPLRGID